LSSDSTCPPFGARNEAKETRAAVREKRKGAYTGD
jgi:hypothetical protein